MIDGVRTRLIWNICLYYGVCFVLVISAGLTHPEWMKYLPFGGLDILPQQSTPIEADDLMGQMLDTHRPAHLFDDAMNLLSALVGALIVMVPVRWVYMTEGLKKKSWSAEVATSLLVLPLVVAAIIYVVKYSLPLAFALTGIFAGVRYRTALKNQSDAIFVFACIAVGLAAGTRSLGIGLLLATFFTLIMIFAPPIRGDAPD